MAGTRSTKGNGSKISGSTKASKRRSVTYDFSDVPF
jgi:hypothetical protein